MFGSYEFGTVVFGETKATIQSTTPLLPYSSADFIPQHLAEQDLYSGLTKVLDYLLYNYHHTEIQKMAGLYDVFHPSFNAEQTVQFLGGDDFIVETLSPSQTGTLCLILSSLYEIKGLRRGIENILSMVGIPAILYESWEVADEVETGIPSRPDIFNSAIWTEKISQCSVAVVFDATGRLVTAGIDSTVLKVVESLLWVCARINSYMWVMNYRGDGLEDVTTPSTDSSSFTMYQTFCDKYRFYSELDWCFLFKPIIENITTPDEDKKLAIFTERPLVADITVNGKYGRTVNDVIIYDGFLDITWSSGRWSLCPWDLASLPVVSIDYSVIVLEDNHLTPPLFYSLSKNDVSEYTYLNDTYFVSFTIEANKEVPVIFSLISDPSGSFLTAAKNKTIVDLSDTWETIGKSSSSKQSSYQIINTVNGSKQVTLYPLSVESDLLVLCIQGMLIDQTSVHISISDFKVEQVHLVSNDLIPPETPIIDFSSSDLVSYNGYTASRSYYTQSPSRTMFRGYASNCITPSKSTITVPFVLLDGQLLYITGNLPAQLTSDSYYAINSKTDNSNNTTFQLSLTPLGDPIDLSALDFTGIEYVYYLELTCGTLNRLQLGTSQDQKYGWIVSDDGSVEALTQSQGGYVVSGIGVISATYPVWGQNVSYAFNKIGWMGNHQMIFDLPLTMSGAITISYDISLVQGEVTVSWGIQEYDSISDSFSSVPVIDVFNDPGSASVSLASPGYLPIMGKSFGFQVSSDFVLGRSKALLNSFTVNDYSPYLSILSSNLSLLASLPALGVVYVYEEGSPKLVGTGFYHVINYVEDSGTASFDLAIITDPPTTPIPIVLHNPNQSLNDSLTFLAIPANATISNIQVKCDDVVMSRGVLDFEEVGTDPEDTPYWKVNDESRFWKIAKEEDSFCCNDSASPALELGDESIDADLYSDGTIIHYDDNADLYPNWDMEDKTTVGIKISEIVPYDEVNPDSSLIPIIHNFAAGTQILINPTSDTDVMPKKTDDSFLINWKESPRPENCVYYIIPYGPSGLTDKPHYIKIALSYSDAMARTSIPLLGGAATTTFDVWGAFLPPSWREYPDPTIH